MGPKVSVVVPVWNPGSFLDPCIESLLGQSMLPEELELIFVDDGSTDETPARLAELAERHDHVRVVTIPNSGWPGKPRNVGTDLAAGEYVMYVDQDDALQPDSLARMYGLGAANEADVVLGKVISDFRGVHHELYRRQRPRCDVFSAELMNSLTPHKMLRVAFLREHDIRYPEGRRRLEDQLFMAKIYFAARAATIVSDYVCYRYQRRADGGNAGSRQIDPAGYYGNLREVLDVVDAYTEPGPQRDHFYLRFLRTEMLGRLSGADLASAPEDYLSDLHHEVRRLMEERFPSSVDDGLGAVLRPRASLVRRGTIAEIADQAAAVARIRGVARLTKVRYRRGHQFSLTVEGRLVVEGRPLLLERAPSGWLLPRELAGAAATDSERAVEPVEEMRGDLVVIHRSDRDEWFVPSPLQVRLEVEGDHAEVVVSGVVTLDLARAAGGRPLRRGVHDLVVRVHALGLTRNGRLPADPALRLPMVVDRKRRVHRLYQNARGQLSAEVAAPPRRVPNGLAAARFIDLAEGRLGVDLGVVWTSQPTGLSVVLTSEAGRVLTWPLGPPGRRQTVWVVAAGPGRLMLPTGRYRARLELPGWPGQVELKEPFVLDAVRRRRWLRSDITRSARSAARWARHVVRRRPSPTDPDHHHESGTASR